MKIYVTGCSITAGEGFPDNKKNLSIYPNRLALKYHADCINDAEGGASNLKIFTKAAKAIIDDRADIYVIQWSAPHRHWMYPAPDRGIYIGSSIEHNHHAGFVEQFQKYNHDYPNLMSVIDYCRIITELARARDRRVVFVNGMLYWKPSWSDLYMRSLLEDLDPMSQKDFQERFSNNLDLLDTASWANLWTSIVELKQDDAPLDQHPGPLTHGKITDLVTTVIDTTQRSL